MQLKEARPSFSSSPEFWKAMRKKFGLQKKAMQQMEDKIEGWREYCQRHHLSTSGFANAPVQAKGKRRSWLKRKVKSIGARAKGGGRKNEFSWAIDKLKYWIEIERSYGHSLSKSDLCFEFIDILEKRIAHEECQQTQKDLYQKKVNQLKKAGKIANNYVSKLIMWTESEWLTPHLLTELSPLEERAGAQLTWQSMDLAIWKAAFSTIEELNSSVARAEEFRTRVKHVVIGASDQVPFWVKTNSSKTIYA